jgi:hypothetical protein
LSWALDRPRPEVFERQIDAALALVDLRNTDRPKISYESISET